jgi:ArsR family transcriptional regulator
MKTAAQPDPLARASRLASSLANPARLRLLAALRTREVCVCHLVDLLGLDQSTVSRHLATLAEAGLLSVRRDGRWAHYKRVKAERTAPEGRAFQMVDALLTEAPEIANDQDRLDAICCAPGGAR